MESKVIPKGFPTDLDHSAKIVETLIKYLYFRHLNYRRSLNKLPEFVIEPEIALELLNASIDLGI